MAVEYTAGVTDVPFDAFVALLPAQDWGVELDHDLGGERQILDTDAQGRAVSQVERMVLSALPCDFEDALLNQDMTKAERILYGDDAITVYWRVYYSDNGTTAADVGSVSFVRHDAGTQVVFHSAHSLRAFHVPLPNAVAMASLGTSPTTSSSWPPQDSPAAPSRVPVSA